MYGVMEGYLNRAVSMVMQQMSGLQTDYYRDYNCEPIDVNTNGRWTAMYGTGGLIDMNTTQEVAPKTREACPAWYFTDVGGPYFFNGS